MAASLDGILRDLEAETTVLDDVLGQLSVDDWECMTPAEGWAIRDQVSHLAFFDEAAVLAATQPERFRADAERLKALGPNFPDLVAERFRSTSPSELRMWFREARRELLETFALIGAKDRLPWYGPDMSAMSCVTARLMETWAHGQDVFDTFGVEHEPTDRLRSVAHLGVSTLGFSFQLRGLQPPTVPVSVRLVAPDGSQWSWGDPHAEDSVTGPAVDFCLVVTQRRHVSDTQLIARGPVARQWLGIAQAFAGAPGPGRSPLKTIRRIS